MRIDHVAHHSRSARATHRFYADVLGLRLVQAYAGHELTLVYALPDGGSLVFTAVRDATAPKTDDAAWERQHVGLAVPTHDDFDAWLERLKRSGVRHRVVDDERVYFADPDGLVLELEVASPTTVDPSAFETLACWEPE